MLIALAILNILATIGLILALFGMANAHKIKIDLNFLATVLIAMLFISCAIFLSFHSFMYYAIYGCVAVVVNIFFILLGDGVASASILSLILTFLCWPQFICFVIFLLIHTEIFENDKK